VVKIKFKYLNELLLVYYIWSFSLLKIVFTILPNYSNQILIINTLMVFILNLIYNKFRINKKIIVIAFLVSLLYFIEIIFRKNDFISSIYYNFIIFGLIPMYLFSFIENKRKVIEYYSYLSILALLIYAYEPFNNYKYLSNYMGFGFEIVLPAFLGIYLLYKEKTKNRKYEKSKIKRLIIILLVVITIIFSIIFSNKGTMLSVLFFILVLEFIYEKENKKKYLIVIMCCLVIINFKSIVNVIYNYCLENDMPTYSIITLNRMVNEDISFGLSGRDVIWANTLTLLKDNIILGNGTGYYQQVSEMNYSHNIVLDILVQYGIVGFILFFIIIFKGIKKIFLIEKEEKILGILFLCMWFPKLFFSNYFQREIGFWLFIVWSLNIYKQIKSDKVNNLSDGKE
jgi:O-antigen ligase